MSANEQDPFWQLLDPAIETMEAGVSKNRTRAITLVSGKVIQLYNHAKLPEGGGANLHICKSCHSPHVQPINWAEREDHKWDLLLRCPNCEKETSGVHTTEEVGRLEDALDLGLTNILQALNDITHFLREEEIDNFVNALGKDRILPEDF